MATVKHTILSFLTIPRTIEFLVQLCRYTGIATLATNTGPEQDAQTQMKRSEGQRRVTNARTKNCRPTSSGDATRNKS